MIQTLLVLSLAGAAQAKTERAESFELVDARGRVSAKLAAAGDGAELLMMTHGRLGARVTTAPGYPAVELYGSDGKPRLVVQVVGGDSPDVALYSEEGYRFHLAVSSGSQPTLELVSRDGRASEMLTFARLGNADLPELYLLSDQGKVCVEASASPEGAGLLTVMNPSGAPRASLGGANGVATFSERREPVWRAPGPKPELH